MKRILRMGCICALLLVCVLSLGMTAQAKGEKTIRSGIYAGNVDLSGMTKEEALRAVGSFVDGLKDTPITLLTGADSRVVVTVGELGITWANPELVTEALEVGTRGNVIERYKRLKDLEHKNLVLPIRLSFDLQAISDFLTFTCKKYDVEPVNMSLVRENGQFRIVEGQRGYVLDVEMSIDRINDRLTGNWDYQPCVIELDVAVREPKGSAEELSRVTDILGSFTTSFSGSSADRKANIKNGCSLIDGVTLYPGEEFSTYQRVSPFTEGNGYFMAGSYLNGRVVDSLGGGICQVSSTLYNAVLLAELNVTMRYNHSMTVSYVDISADAAIAESSGKDFKFVNNLEYPIYIEGYTENNRLTFNIYGMESRSADREVRYESEILEIINPPADDIHADNTRPIGYIVTDSGARVGYKARLWKVVLEAGREVSRAQINSSSYKMVPRSVTVGTATSDPAAYNEIMAAIGTGSLNYVREVAARLTAAPSEAAPTPTAAASTPAPTAASLPEAAIGDIVE